MTSPRFPPRYYRTIPSNEEFSGFKQIPRRMILIWGTTGLTVRWKNIGEWKSSGGSTGVVFAISTTLGASSRCWCRCHSLRNQYSFCSRCRFVHHYPTEYKHN